MRRKIDNIIAKYDKTIRVITVAPIMALILLLCVYFLAPDAGMTAWRLIFAIIFLMVMPLLAYPLQPLIPGFKGKGRKGQRNLAIVASVMGYIFGIVYCCIFGAPRVLFIIYLTYLFSGIAIAIFSKFTPIKASGHACGIAGPVAAGTYFLGPWALTGVIIYTLVFVSSVRMKRHTVPEFLAGGLIPILALFAAVAISGYYF